jgi:hypothetical protein
MDSGIMAMLYNIGGRLLNYGFNALTSPRQSPLQKRIEHIDRLIQAIPDGEIAETPVRAPESQKELLPATVSPSEESPTQDIATACVPCAIGHYAGAARLLNEAIRFRDEGIESNQVLDDIAGAIGELNAMERVDLTPERLQKTPEWERVIADEALRESRKLRHRLEGIRSMEEIEKAAADTESYYKKLNRQWYKGRFGKLGPQKAEVIAEKASGS